MSVTYVGFDSLPKQLEKKLLLRPFELNILLVGQSGLGKSTLLNTLFASHLVDSSVAENGVPPTIEIVPTTHVLEENGVQLKLTVVDCPGYGDQVNNTQCCEPLVRYVNEQYANYLRKELTAVREKYISDTRIHCALFFISPTGHSLKPIDIMVMQKLGEICNVVPVIAKSDSLTLEERFLFKERIRREIEFHGIRVFPLLGNNSPFAVVGSEKNVVVDGKAVRGRRNKWGIVNVEDETHCEFSQLRDFLFRTHTQDLFEETNLSHYEGFRSKQLLALKENRERSQ